MRHKPAVRSMEFCQKYVKQEIIPAMRNLRRCWFHILPRSVSATNLYSRQCFERQFSKALGFIILRLKTVSEISAHFVKANITC